MKLDEDDKIQLIDICLLMEEWNPLEIYGSINEYACEALEVFNILKKGGGAKELDEYFRGFFEGNLSGGSKRKEYVRKKTFLKVTEEKSKMILELIKKDGVGVTVTIKDKDDKAALDYADEN